MGLFLLLMLMLRYCIKYLVSNVLSVFFFFSSRRRHTRLVSDWSSDVCSSDLHAFQEVIVQVIKEGMGTKGPTLSTHISIAGRYLVLAPWLNRVAVSRKIDDEATRQRLKEIMADLNAPKGVGFIIRTAAVDRNVQELQSDLSYLVRLWEVFS